ncbi:MAG: hypothetical protein H0V15_02450, partial [Solirubrobacterales bacterium]|nr:hypothetical protein [Solirubrobacterales bacterium]
MALPIALASIVLVASGVSVSELGRFAAYQVGLLLIPGVLLWWALSGEAGLTLRSVCVGWALGHAIEIGAFALCAGTGARSLTPFAIIAIGTAALVWVTVRKAAPSQPADDEPLPRHWPLVCGGVVLLAIVYLAASLFTQTPLPEAVTEVSYFQDYVFHLSVSAEALHHWPIGEPKVAGESLPYHTFFYMHIAATAEVTGIELPVLLFRLVPSVLLAIIVLQLAWAGRALTGRAWAGPVAALLLIAFGELDPNPDQAFVFFNTFFYSLHTSPTFLLGLLVFIPVLVLAAELGEAKPRAGQRRGRWAALAVLLGACAGTKATILPVLAGGLIVYVAVSLALDRRAVRAPLAVAGLTAAIFALSFAGLYDGGEGGLRLEPPGLIADMRPVLQLEPRFEGVPVVEQGFWVAATVLGLAGFAAASLFGTAWLFRRRLSRAPPWALFLAAVFVASLVPFLLLRHPGGSQNFFTYYGLVAAAPLAAVALLTLLSSWRGSPSGARRGLIGGAAGVCAALALGTLVDDSRELHR